MLELDRLETEELDIVEDDENDDSDCVLLVDFELVELDSEELDRLLDDDELFTLLVDDDSVDVLTDDPLLDVDSELVDDDELLDRLDVLDDEADCELLLVDFDDSDDDCEELDSVDVLELDSVLVLELDSDEAVDVLEDDSVLVDDSVDPLLELRDELEDDSVLLLTEDVEDDSDSVDDVLYDDVELLTVDSD